MHAGKRALVPLVPYNVGHRDTVDSEFFQNGFKDALNCVIINDMKKHCSHERKAEKTIPRMSSG